MPHSLDTLQVQISNIEDSLMIIDVRKSEYAEQTAIPIDLIRSEGKLKEQLEELRSRLVANSPSKPEVALKGGDQERPPSPPNRPFEETASTAQVTLRSIREKHQALARKYLPGQRERSDPPSEDSLERYAELFRLVVDPEGAALQEGPIFQALANFASEQPCDLLRVQGDAGTGKTTLLALLYFDCLSRHLQQKSKVFPFFLHMREYDRFDEEEMLQKCRQDLAEIKSIITYEEEFRFILVVDGFENFLEFRKEVEEEILTLSHPSLKKIVGICLGIDPSDHPQRFEWDETPVVNLRSLDPRSQAEVFELAEAFFRTTGYVGDAQSYKDFKENLNRFDFSQINLRTLAMLMRLRREAYRGVNNLFDLLQRYCREFLSPNAIDTQYAPILRSVAAQAYGHVYEDMNLSPSGQRGDQGWLLVHHNVDIREYLIARHVTSCLLNSAENKEGLAVLKRVYPYRITRHAKGILTEKPQVQRKAVEASKEIVASDEVIVRTNVSYFLGRLTDPGPKRDATQLLRKLLVQMLEGKGQGMDILRLMRTIYVSLIYLGDRTASGEYIAKLVANQDWDQINRGFHLEYYGDIVVDPVSDYSHEDTMVDFPYTFKRLFTSIHKNLRARSYIPRELEIYTLFSLAQKRHARGELKSEVRGQLLDLLDRILATRLDSEVLREYLRMLQIHFRKETFSVGEIVEDLYRIKEEMRRGWVVRGLRNTEHVADHMYGAYLLGLLFLPGRMAEEDYNKEDVLKMVLIHDLGEAYTGDILSKEKREDDRETEAGWLEYLGMLGTYIELADTREFALLSRAYNAMNTINARLAHDLDDLDVFVQIHLYRRRGEIQDFEEWKKAITEELLTQEGRRILDLLHKHFEGGGGSAAGLQAIHRRGDQVSAD